MANRDTTVAELCWELGVGRVTLYRYVNPRGVLNAPTVPTAQAAS